MDAMSESETASVVGDVDAVVEDVDDEATDACLVELTEEPISIVRKKCVDSR